MKKVRCVHCGAVMAEDALAIRWGTREEPTVSVCPRCGFEELEDVRRCGSCGGYYGDLEGEDGLCSPCAGRLRRAFRAVLMEQFTPAERDYLRAADGIL